MTGFTACQNFAPGQHVTVDGLADDSVFALVNGRAGTVVEVRRLTVAVRLDQPITLDDVHEVFGPDGEMFDMVEDAGDPDEGHVIAMTPRFLISQA